jgi:hypothetical protein
MHEQEMNEGANEAQRNAQGPLQHLHPGLAELEPRLPAPRPRMGRPVAITPELAGQLCLLLSVGMSRRQAAAYLGIDPSTISRTAARNAEFAENLRQAEDLSHVQPLMTLVGESRKNWRAAAWLLDFKRKYPGPLSEEEKDERDQERLADTKRAVKLSHQLDAIDEAAREDAIKARKQRAMARRVAEVAALAKQR